MLRRTLFVLALGGALALGTSTLVSPVVAEQPCPRPNCPLPLCPECTFLVCDPGHCRFHCEFRPDCLP